MKCLVLVWSVLACLCAQAIVKFNALNVRGAEYVVGVTTPEFRTATNQLWSALDRKVDYDDEGVETRHFSSTTSGYSYYCNWWIRVKDNKPYYVRLQASINGRSCDHEYTESEIEESYTIDNEYFFNASDLVGRPWNATVKEDGSIEFDDDGDVFNTEVVSIGKNLNLNEATRDALAESMSDDSVNRVELLFKTNNSVLVQTIDARVRVLSSKTNAYDFSNNQGIYRAMKDIIESLGGSVTNFPTFE